MIVQYDMGPGIMAFSTERHGCGYSKGNYADFNINPYCGDDPQHIRCNRELLCGRLGIDDDCLIMPHQTHQTNIACIDDKWISLSSSERSNALESIDALITDKKEICIGVSTADCIPVLLYDSFRHVIAAVHAGWRGSVARIARKVVDEMCRTYNSSPRDITAQIGPGISLRSFEVGQEVYDAFAQADFDMTAISKRYPAAGNEGEGKWHIDLPQCNRLQLKEAGLTDEHIMLFPVCAYEQHDRFFSARRLGIHSGRIFTGAVLI